MNEMVFLYHYFHFHEMHEFEILFLIWLINCGRSRIFGLRQLLSENDRYLVKLFIEQFYITDKKIHGIKNSKTFPV